MFCSEIEWKCSIKWKYSSKLEALQNITEVKYSNNCTKLVAVTAKSQDSKMIDADGTTLIPFFLRVEKRHESKRLGTAHLDFNWLHANGSIWSFFYDPLLRSFCSSFG